MTEAQKSPDAAVTVSRMQGGGTPDFIRLQFRVIGEKTEIIELDVSLADFASAMTGRAEVPAMLNRRWIRK